MYLNEMVALSNINLHLTCSKLKNNLLLLYAYFHLFVEASFTQCLENYILIFWTSVFWHRIFSCDSNSYNSSKQQCFESLAVEKQA